MFCNGLDHPFGFRSVAGGEVRIVFGSRGPSLFLFSLNLIISQIDEFGMTHWSKLRHVSVIPVKHIRTH